MRHAFIKFAGILLASIVAVGFSSCNSPIRPEQEISNVGKIGNESIAITDDGKSLDNSDKKENSKKEESSNSEKSKEAEKSKSPTEISAKEDSKTPVEQPSKNDQKPTKNDKSEVSQGSIGKVEKTESLQQSQPQKEEVSSAPKNEETSVISEEKPKVEEPSKEESEPNPNQEENSQESYSTVEDYEEFTEVFTEVDFYFEVPDGTIAESGTLKISLPECIVHCISKGSEGNYIISWYENTAKLHCYNNPEILEEEELHQKFQYKIAGCADLSSIPLAEPVHNDHLYLTTTLYDEYAILTDDFIIPNSYMDQVIKAGSIVQIFDLNQSPDKYVIRNGLGYTSIPRDTAKIVSLTDLDFVKMSRFGFTPREASPLVVKEHSYDSSKNAGYAQAQDHCVITTSDGSTYKVPKGTIISAMKKDGKEAILYWYSSGEATLPLDSIRFLKDNSEVDLWMEPTCGMIYDRGNIPPGDIFHQANTCKWAITNKPTTVFDSLGHTEEISAGTYIRVWDFSECRPEYNPEYFIQWYCIDARNKGCISKDDVDILPQTLTSKEEEKILTRGKTAGVIY